eukprot:tig00020703_g13136.t1
MAAQHETLSMACAALGTNPARARLRQACCDAGLPLRVDSDPAVLIRGEYGGHGEELLLLQRCGSLTQATKITGDANVPACEISWMFDRVSRAGKGRIARTDFQLPEWTSGAMPENDELRFVWEGHGDIVFSVERVFERVLEPSASAP